MRKTLTAACFLVGLLLLLGAAGDSDRQTGAYIFERAGAGAALLAAGIAMNWRKRKVEKVQCLDFPEEFQRMYCITIDGTRYINTAYRHKESACVPHQGNHRRQPIKQPEPVTVAIIPWRPPGIKERNKDMDTRCGTISGVPIVGYCRVKDTDIFLPMIETDTDIQWVEGCIKNREDHPEYYPDEDVPAVIAQQKAHLARLRAKEPRRPKPTSGRRVLIDLENNDAVYSITPTWLAYLNGMEVQNHG